MTAITLHFVSIELDADSLRSEVMIRWGGSVEVVWVDRGDEVLVRPGTLRLDLEPGVLRAQVELETIETGAGELEVVLVLAAPGMSSSLIAVTDETARGHPLLAARWGRALQDAVWGALLDLAGSRATGLTADAGRLVVHEGKAG